MNYISPNFFARLIGYLAGLGVVSLVLWGVFVPSVCTMSPTRSKVSRVRSDMRSLAEGLEAYHADFHVYPAYSADPAEGGLRRGGTARLGAYPSLRIRNQSALATLTTPLAYYPFGNGRFMYESDVVDAFAEIRGQTFAYITPGDGTKGWILISPGPDGVFNPPWSFYETAYDPAHPGDIANLMPYTYDPTNGTLSSGDVWRVKQ